MTPLVVDDRDPNHYQEGQIDLSQGLHPIRIRFTDRTASTHINVFWAPPGSDVEDLPQEVLFPPWVSSDAEAISQEPQAPAQPLPKPVEKPTDQQAIPEIQAQILWQTGQCGSASGQFRSPNGLTLDRQGNLWVADTGNSRLVEIDPKGKIVAVLGSRGHENGQFHQPFDLAVEPDGGLVVLDSANARGFAAFRPAQAVSRGLGRRPGHCTARAGWRSTGQAACISRTPAEIGCCT